MAASLRLLVVVVILGLLARAARHAWMNRRLAVAVWSRIRPRHVVGALGLLIVVMVVALGLMVLVPVTAYGAGSLIGLTGNAVFAPLEEAVVRADPGQSGGTAAGTALLAGAAAFLVLLLVLLPWLAHVEEVVFRAGLEDAGIGRQVTTALKFGLVHMIMLIPLAAALAISVAGFVYGRIYRASYRRALSQRRSLAGPLGVPVDVPFSPREARSRAVLDATVWHTTFNSLIVVLLLLAILVEAV